MKVRGPVIVVVLGGLAVLFMVGVYFVSNEVRQEYRVASRGDVERTDLDLDGDRVVWLETVGRSDGAVLTYKYNAKERPTLEPRNASLAHPVLLDGSWATWVRGAAPGPFQVAVHDFGTSTSASSLVLVGNLTLPGRTLEGTTLIVRGVVDGEDGLWRVDLAAPDKELVRVPLKDPPSKGLVLAKDRLWWAQGNEVRSLDLATGRERTPIDGGGPVLDLEADGDLVAWTHGTPEGRRVRFADLGNGTTGEVTGLPGDLRGPAVNGTRVLFLQTDGLVRLKDLATGEERVLPARNQENIHLRLGPTHAAWLSGTIQGHNILMVPLASAG